MTLTDEQKEEYDIFMNKQFKILEGHHKRIMLRCYNKFVELENKNEGKKK